MDAVDEIKSRLNIEDIIGEYVELKRAGRNYKGLSPFGAEKTPSFMVSPEKQIWHDFSSGKGGNIFSFVMEMEGLDFKGALELLARKAGVDLDQFRSSGSAQRSKLKERLQLCMEQATRFYQLQLKKSSPAIDYVFKHRGLDKSTVLDFKIGYSPQSGSALSEHLLSKGFTGGEIKQAGLGNTYNGRMRDMFRGRIMISLMDSFGKPIGFTARLLKDEPNAPKYINTPQTLLYDKGRHVFGLHIAKEAIRKQGFVVVVEGNMDVIASHQAGVRNVVATAGTAMTKFHLKELSRFTNDIRLSFDQDSAGQNATERTIPLASDINCNLKIITIPAGKDPDELIRQDVTLWQSAVEQAEDAVDWLIARKAAQFDITTGTGKKAFIAAIMPTINTLQDTVEKEHYQRLLANMVEVSFEALNSKAVAPLQKTARKKPHAQLPPIEKESAEALKLQNQLLALIVAEKEIRQHIDKLQPAMFDREQAKLVVEYLQKNPDIATAKVGVDLPEVEDYVKMLLLLYEELYSNLEYVELPSEAARLQVRVIEQYVKRQKAIILQQLSGAADEKTVNKLLEKVKQLDQLLK